MHYMGSKARHASEIIAITCAGRKSGQAYVEPFVGGGNVICRVPAEYGPRIANDINKYMVALLDAVGNRGWLPPETMSKDEHTLIKANPDSYPPELVGFAATGPTFGSVWMGPWAPDPDGKPGMRYRQARDAVKKDAPGLKGVVFHCGSFDQFGIPPESIIYCDPPYAGDALNSSERGYGSKVKIEVGETLSKNNWSTKKFWGWADSLADAGHRVFVSEYNGPSPRLYGATQELKTKLTDVLAKFRDVQANPASLRSEYDAATASVKAVEAEVKKCAERQAARWCVLWEKEVSSDFHSEREKGVKEAKREVERLFHRIP